MAELLVWKPSSRTATRPRSVAVNFLVFTARCYAKRNCYGKSSVRLPVRLSVYDVKVSWLHRLEIFKNNFTVS